MAGFVEARKPDYPKTLFEDWERGMEQAVLDLIDKTDSTDLEQIAQHLQLSKESAIFLLTKLAREDKISITTVKRAS
ncbi:MAG TPA: hypothetical protein VEG60_00625 [Candidatus Binatia bacterium]|nr:hypothetical protein [Candidatus Binatia bacterium]